MSGTGDGMGDATGSARVLFVDHSGLPGGGQLGLARYLALTGLDDVHLLLLAGGTAFDEVALGRGLAVEIVEGRRGRPSSREARSRLRRSIAELRPELVVANSNRAGLILASLPRIAGERRVFLMRDDLNPARKGFGKRLLLGRWMLRRFDGVIANSRWTASTIPVASIRERAGIAFPVCGIDGTPRPAHPAQGGALRILSLSRLAHWKGIHVLLAAARILQARGRGGEISVTIAGSGAHEDPAYEQALRRAVASAPFAVEMVGHVADTRELRAASDVLVACSISPEPFGQVVVQGLASGLVTIASAQGGPTEIVEDGVDGFLIAPDDPEALAELLERLLDDPELRTRIGDAAVASASRFSDAAAVEALDALLRREVER
ncbi:glycosyltransferase family 4 protein [Protaetiibacter mangrovi]|uniref:Glycosyltransferase family 4 protein n=1 Tax=Protaetiibacter mangrovi TaxID=2970926 RepID=A0ABT1ZHR5_9MICO|nr:glycosyltransferase family 4 protein [Protaetiibacter mangrovi]MCS0500228.1 glycosyltransferase family 4 protein [Protaetiibacter mangrovi]TPX02399.1 glycosyltransferase family 4 protein [Schumannella luteola]